jgi:hypothetical protein
MRFTPFGFMGSQIEQIPITSGSYIYVNASNSLSYPGTGRIWNDLSGNGLNGNLNSSVFSTNPNKFTVGMGSGNTINFTGLTVPSTSVYSISTWFYYPTAAGSDEVYLWNKGDSSGLAQRFIGGVASDRSFISLVGTTGGSPLLAQGGSASLNTWYYHTTTWQPAVAPSTGYELKLYVNGSLISTVGGAYNANYTTLNPSANNWYIGAIYQGGAPLLTTPNSIFIGQFELYKSVLNSTQILNNFNATKSNYGY